MEPNHKQQIMQLKLSDLKNAFMEPVSFSYSLAPLSAEDYNHRKAELNEFLKKPIESANQLEPFSSIIMGIFEGKSLLENLHEIFETQFGSIQEATLRQFLKNRLENKFYGHNRKKQNGIFEAKNLQDIGTLYNIKEIKAVRKINSQKRNYLKALRTFLQAYDESSNKQNKDIEMLFISFFKIEEEQRKYQELLDKNKASSSEKQVKLQDPLKLQQLKTKNQQQKNIQKQNQKKEKKKKAEKKKKESSNAQEQMGADCKAEKQKQGKQLQQKQTQKDSNKSEPKTQKKKKQSAKANGKQTPKKNYGAPILSFFKKEPLATSVNMQESPQKNQEAKSDNLIDYLLEKTVKPLEELKQQIKSGKMQVENSQSITFYSNIHLHLSRLEFINYDKQEPSITYICPHQQFQNVLYMEDTSVQYEQLCGEVINNSFEEDNQSEQAESANGTIVPDGYFSENQVLSESGSKDNVEFSARVGKQWTFSQQNPEALESENYQLLVIEERSPILLQQQQAEQKIAPELTLEFYKQIHGYYQNKDILLKDLINLADNKVSKKALAALIRDVSEKRGIQRIVKQYYIEELKETIQEAGTILSQAKKDKEDLKKIEKQEKINAIITEQLTKAFTINDLLSVLKTNGYRFTKRELKAYIENSSNEVVKKSGEKIWNTNEFQTKLQLTKEEAPKQEMQPEIEAQEKTIQKKEMEAE